MSKIKELEKKKERLESEVEKAKEKLQKQQELVSKKEDELKKMEAEIFSTFLVENKLTMSELKELVAKKSETQPEPLTQTMNTGGHMNA